MAAPTKPDPAPDTVSPDPYPDYPRAYGWFFQAWLVMFLAVICLSLGLYLLSYLPR